MLKLCYLVKKVYHHKLKSMRGRSGGKSSSSGGGNNDGLIATGLGYLAGSSGRVEAIAHQASADQDRPSSSNETAISIASV